ncbi:hypothetical protein [uncultured Mediterranean phage uvMED]|nr:hypothetical protein [uncultured Mediterranean phage uvMED]
MIRIGYVKNDNTRVTYDTVSGAPKANASINNLKESKSGDSTILYFYLESQVSDSEWDEYASVDPI